MLFLALKKLQMIKIIPLGFAPPNKKVPPPLSKISHLPYWGEFPPPLKLWETLKCIMNTSQNHTKVIGLNG